MDDGIYMNLPLLVKQSVLFPGQTLPMTVFGPQIIEMLQTCIQNDRTFGVVCYGYPEMERIGTTAEIYEYTDGGWTDHGRREFRLKAKGRQRFKILRIITQVSFYLDKCMHNGSGGPPSCSHMVQEKIVSIWLREKEMHAN